MQSAVRLPSARAARVALFALLLLAVVGCDKEPVRPRPIARLTAPAAPMRTTRMPTDDDNGGNHGGIPSPPETWHGGAHSIAIGPHLTTSEVLAQADTLRAVMVAKNQFAQRGYIRRADLDTIVTSPNATTAFLGYQKPGYALNQMEAFIVIVGRRIDVSASGYRVNASEPGSFYSMIYPITYYAIQVSGGLIEQAASDSVLFLDTPEDPAISVTSTVVGNTAIPMIGPPDFPLVPQDWWLDWLTGSYFSSWDMWYFNFPNSYLAYGLTDMATDEWRYICERASDPNNRLIISMMIGFATGVAMVVLPETGPIDRYIIRKAIICGAIGETGSATNYWNEHR